MSNPHGTPIWYELMTADTAASTAFYEAVIDGWRVGASSLGPVEYREIGAGGGAVGGMLQLSPAMLANGAAPGWMVYFGVDDVDATAAAVTAHGGSVHIAPNDMEGVGRMAMVADPQGTPFYLMCGFSPEASHAWERSGMGKCNWQELVTPGPDAARAFYAAVLGWSYPDKMAMPGGGEYVFAEAGGETIGAVMPTGLGQPAGWTFYFRAPDIEAAAEAVRAKGGTVHAGPMDVPGGDRIIVASDAHGVPFGVAAPGQ